jgi:hypothetical protein
MGSRRKIITKTIRMASSGRKGKKTEKRQDKMAVVEENVVFQSAIKKFKDQDTQNFNFACCFVWV